MAETPDSRSLPQLLSDLSRDVTTLVRKETELLRTEFSEKLHQLGRGAGEVVAGAICLLAALLVLLQAIVVALSDWIGPGWASLAVGVVVAVIGAILVRTGTSNMGHLTPDRTTRQVGEDAKLAREHLR